MLTREALVVAVTVMICQALAQSQLDLFARRLINREYPDPDGTPQIDSAGETGVRGFEDSEREALKRLNILTNDEPKKMDGNHVISDDKLYQDVGPERNNEEVEQLFALLDDSHNDLQSDRYDSSHTQTGDGRTHRFNIRMPDVKIDHDDTYLCMAVKIPSSINSTLYINEFIPHANENVAHHMILYVCNEPGTKDTAVWNCGGMMAESAHQHSRFTMAPVCRSGLTSIWAWAKDAPTLKLPEGVAFEVGEGTGLNYIVLNAHFKSMKTSNANHAIHNTGVTAIGTTVPQPKVAGMYLSARYFGSIPPRTSENLDIVCRYADNLVLHPFAFRVHTHALGVRVFGYRVRNQKWALIGEEDPQNPEMFYPVKNKGLVIRPGDRLASRCVMANFRDRVTSIGAKHTDEMCNFYMMYWIPRGSINKTLSTRYCVNINPVAHWRDYFITRPY